MRLRASNKQDALEAAEITNRRAERRAEAWKGHFHNERLVRIEAEQNLIRCEEALRTLQNRITDPILQKMIGDALQEPIDIKGEVEKTLRSSKSLR